MDQQPRTCAKCKRPMTPQEVVAYRVQCEDCWTSKLPTKKDAPLYGGKVVNHKSTEE